eukprot:Gb_38382 [translate_table: standard]
MTMAKVQVAIVPAPTNHRTTILRPVIPRPVVVGEVISDYVDGSFPDAVGGVFSSSDTSFIRRTMIRHQFLRWQVGIPPTPWKDRTPAQQEVNRIEMNQSDFVLKAFYLTTICLGILGRGAIAWLEKNACTHSPYVTSHSTALESLRIWSPKCCSMKHDIFTKQASDLSCFTFGSVPFKMQRSMVTLACSSLGLQQHPIALNGQHLWGEVGEAW